MPEEMLGGHIRNIMKCQEDPNAYQELYKKGMFFESLDTTKVSRKKRLRAVLNSIWTLDKCHK